MELAPWAGGGLAVCWPTVDRLGPSSPVAM
eukprot:COSAG06_NODE_50691_length_317_cov_0.518349_1_plen_29_part_01